MSFIRFENPAPEEFDDDNEPDEPNMYWAACNGRDGACQENIDLAELEIEHLRVLNSILKTDLENKINSLNEVKKKLTQAELKIRDSAETQQIHMDEIEDLRRQVDELNQQIATLSKQIDMNERRSTERASKKWLPVHTLHLDRNGQPVTRSAYVARR